MTIKPKAACRWDCVSLGKIMLRLDPGEGRVKTARSFVVWEGGGEYNVTRALKRCFCLDTTVITSIPENDIGRLLFDFLCQGGSTHLILNGCTCDDDSRRHIHGVLGGSGKISSGQKRPVSEEEYDFRKIQNSDYRKTVQQLQRRKECTQCG